MKPDRWYRAYFFDVDGTVVLGDKIIGGVNECLSELRSRKAIVRFLSNSSSGDRIEHVNRMRRAGIEVYPDEVQTPIEATIEWLSLHYPNAAVFPVGTPILKRRLVESQIQVTDDPQQIDIVLAATDHQLDFAKIQTAFDALYTHKRAFLIATNPDRHSPRPDGRSKPDGGTTIAAIEGCTGVKCQVVIGKPNPHMLRSELLKLGVAPEDALMTGDTIETDIQVAHNAGTASALTLTGDSDRRDAVGLPGDLRPTWVVKHLTDLLPG